MSDQSNKSEKPKMPPWLLTGIMTPDDIIDMLMENTDFERNMVEVSVKLFLEVMHEKLKKGFSVNLNYGTYYPHFGKMDPISGEAELTVQFVPSEEMLEKMEVRRLNRLNNPALN